MDGQSNPMVRDAILREIIRADLLAAIARADHVLALRSDRGLLLVDLDFVQPRTQHAHCFLTILDLRLFVLAGNDRARGQVSDAHRGIGRVHRLSTRTGGTERVNPDVLGRNRDFHFVRFRQHGDRNRRSVDAPLRFRLRHALHAMHAGFVLQLAENFLTAD